jgi:hypothetical protein
MKIDIGKRDPSQILVVERDVWNFMDRTPSVADLAVIRGISNGGPERYAPHNREVVHHSLFQPTNRKRKYLDREVETDVRSVKREEN